MHKALSVIKKRTGHHEDTLRELTVDPRRGVVIGDPLERFRGVLALVPEFHGDGRELDRR